MRGMGMVLLTGAATIVVWKIFAALFVGLLAMALKVALVIGLVYLAMRFFQNGNGQTKEEEEPVPES